MKKHVLLLVTACVLIGWLYPANAQQPRSKPNVILIYADDIGYGDLSCYGNTKLRTPHVDRLAAGGLRFTHAHATAATCTPSRYSLLTGQYAWRRKGTGILPGDAPALIQPGRQTLPGVFQAAGYRTGVVGKWHLGLGERQAPTGTAKSDPARRTLASIRPSSWPPPATAYRRCTSKTAAWSTSIPPTRFG